MRHPAYTPPRRRHRPPRFWVALLASLLMVLGLTSTAAYGKGGAGDDRSGAQAAADRC